MHLERGPIQIALIDNAVRARLGYYPLFHMFVHPALKKKYAKERVGGLSTRL